MIFFIYSYFTDCKDLRKQCGLLKKLGYCTKAKRYMKKHCASSCETCKSKLLKSHLSKLLSRRCTGADTGKNEPPQNFPVSRSFIQYFPDFSLTKSFKVRKCERCGSLNPPLEQHDVFFTHL